MPDAQYKKFVDNIKGLDKPHLHRGDREQNRSIDNVPGPRVTSSHDTQSGSNILSDRELFDDRKDRPSRENRSTLCVVITALEIEMDYVIKLYSHEWMTRFENGVSYKVSQWPVNGGRLTIAVCCTGEMGMVPAAIHTMKAIQTWVPMYVAMTGICAGYKERTGIGDVIVAEQVFDHGAGKIKQGKLQPDFATIPMAPQELTRVKSFANDFRTYKIKEAWPVGVGVPKRDLAVHVKCMASGAAVIGDAQVLAGIEEHKRKIYAVEMEAYGVAKAAHDDGTTFLIAKAPRAGGAPALEAHARSLIPAHMAASHLVRRRRSRGGSSRRRETRGRRRAVMAKGAGLESRRPLPLPPW